MQDERGLARTVGPEQGDPLPRVDVQVHAEQRLVTVGVGEGHTVHLDDRDTHGSLPTGTRTAVTRARAAAAGTTATRTQSPTAAGVCRIGIRPVNPRETIARCTRSPRS
jgi:hypothetical protein